MIVAAVERRSVSTTAETGADITGAETLGAEVTGAGGVAFSVGGGLGGGAIGTLSSGRGDDAAFTTAGASVIFAGDSCRYRGELLMLVFRCIGNGFSFFGGGG